MATSRRTATNENISTYGAAGFGRDYTSLLTWEAATDIDLVSATQSEVLECYDDVFEFDDGGTFSGATANASYYRIIRPAGTIGEASWQGQVGIADGTTGVFFHNQTTSACFNLNEDYFGLQDVMVKYTNPGTSNTIGVEQQGAPGGLLVGVLMFDFTKTVGTARMCRLESGSIAVNCLALRGENSFGFQGNAGTTYYYNCNAIDNQNDGFQEGGGDVEVCKNCLATGNTTDDFEQSGTYTGSVGNASGDATAPGTGPRINQTFTFIDAANDDYHLDDTDAGAKGFGSDLSADGTFAFDDDVDGELRS